jgi:hypothetical protein
VQKPPKIGMRIIKSAVAVFLCFVIYLIRRDGVPFYSAIAAILCMQQYVSSAVKVAWNRTVGTVIGGLFGMAVLLLEQRFFSADMPVVRYILISAMIVPLIYFTVVVKKTAASYITCVVFLSITVSHAADVNPYLFAFNRMLDTLIGIFVSLVVNWVHVPHRKDKQILFLAMLEGALAGESGIIENDTKVKLHALKQEGARIVAASYKTPAQCAALLDEIRLPVIAIGGAAIYDRERKEYLKYNSLDSKTVETIKQCIARADTMAFFYAMAYEKIQVYHMDFTNDEQRSFYEAMRRIQTCVYGEVPKRAEVLQVVVLAEQEMVLQIEREIVQMGEKVSTHCRPCEEDKLMWMLSIRRWDSDFYHMAQYLEQNPEHIVMIGEGQIDARQAVRELADHFHRKKRKA